MRPSNVGCLPIVSMRRERRCIGCTNRSCMRRFFSESFIRFFLWPPDGDQGRRRRRRVHQRGRRRRAGEGECADLFVLDDQGHPQLRGNVSFVRVSVQGTEERVLVCTCAVSSSNHMDPTPFAVGVHTLSLTHTLCVGRAPVGFRRLLPLLSLCCERQAHLPRPPGASPCSPVCTTDAHACSDVTDLCGSTSITASIPRYIARGCKSVHVPLTL